MQKSRSRYAMSMDRGRTNAKNAHEKHITHEGSDIELDDMEPCRYPSSAQTSMPDFDEPRRHPSMVPGFRSVLDFDEKGRRIARKYDHPVRAIPQNYNMEVRVEPMTEMPAIDEDCCFSVAQRPQYSEREVSMELERSTQSPVDYPTHAAFHLSTSGPVHSENPRAASHAASPEYDRGNGGIHSSSSEIFNTPEEVTIQYPEAAIYPNPRSLVDSERDLEADVGRGFMEKTTIPRIWMGSNENLAVRIPITHEIPMLYTRDRRRALHDAHVNYLSERESNPCEFESDDEDEYNAPLPATHEYGLRHYEFVRPSRPGHEEEDDDEWEDVDKWTWEDVIIGTNNHWCGDSIANVSDDSNTPSLNTPPNSSYEDILPKYNIYEPVFRYSTNGVPSAEYHRRQKKYPSDRNRTAPKGPNPFKSIPPKLGKPSSTNRLSDQSWETTRFSYTHLDDENSNSAHPDRFSSQSSRRFQHRSARRNAPSTTPNTSSSKANTTRRTNTSGRYVAPGRNNTSRGPKPPGSKDSCRTIPGAKAAGRSKATGRSKTPKRVRHRPRQAQVVRHAPTMAALLSPCPRMVGGDEYSIKIISPPSAVPINEEYSVMYTQKEQAKQVEFSQKQGIFREHCFSPHLNLQLPEDERYQVFKRKRCIGILWFCSLTFVLLPLLGSGGLDWYLYRKTHGSMAHFEPDIRRQAWWIFASELVAIVLLIIMTVVTLAATRGT